MKGKGCIYIWIIHNPFFTAVFAIPVGQSQLHDGRKREKKLQTLRWCICHFWVSPTFYNTLLSLCHHIAVVGFTLSPDTQQDVVEKSVCLQLTWILHQALCVSVCECVPVTCPKIHNTALGDKTAILHLAGKKLDFQRKVGNVLVGGLLVSVSLLSLLCVTEKTFKGETLTDRKGEH